MSKTTAVCWHCGQALPQGTLLVARVSQIDRPVCCIGCRGAVEWIVDLGLADYYRIRTDRGQRPVAFDSAGADPRGSALMLPRFVHDLPRGRQEILLAFDGIHCAACLWLIERTVAALPGIEMAVVSASARRAHVVWDSALISVAAIVDAIRRTGYAGLPRFVQQPRIERQAESRLAIKRLLVAGLGAMQAMMYAAGLYLGAVEQLDVTTRDLLRWLGILVATPVVFYSARPFFAGAGHALRQRTVSMDVPVALAIVLIYAASALAAIRGLDEVYFESVAMFVFLLLLGRHFEMRARHHTCDLTDALARTMPSYAERVAADGSLERIDPIQLQPGDSVHLAEGGLVPADGQLLSGNCFVNEALLTGESTPVRKIRGDPLFAGSILLDGPARLCIKSVGTNTVIAGIMTLVGRAQAAQPRMARIGERTASRLVARVCLLASLTFVGWLFVEPSRALGAMVAVLVVSCPCAFALATPAAITRALSVLARHGVLVAKPDSLEILARASHIVFDKTGTLTIPSLLPERIKTFGALDARTALGWAAALARQSQHPLAQAIAAGALSVEYRCDDACARVGEGLTGTVAGRRLRLGKQSFASRRSRLDADLCDSLVLADEEDVLAVFPTGDVLRSCARAAVVALQRGGLVVEILSGDAASKVAATAAQLGIDTWKARCNPEDKLDHLQRLRAHEAVVIAVGDGINDAPLLAGANVGIAIASGAAIAQSSSDIVVMGENLDALAFARSTARQMLTVIRQNQRWAVLYNLLAVPLAALGFIRPWLAAVGMSLSSLLVVANALRIGRPWTALSGRRR